jgi:iron complex outermembrane receptor protein
MTYMIPAAGRALRRATVLSLLLPAALWAQRQGGTLVGRVLSGDVAVPSATIILSGGRVILTRVDGRYRLAVPPGRYEVRAQRIGYATGRDTVTILPGQTAMLNFKLERSIAMLEAVASIGARGQVRSVIDAPVPIEVILGTDLRATGRTTTSQMLQALVPGVNVPRSSVAEGSDLIHPITLRGLGPDQVLVLVNGKRRHGSALLNVNGTVGRGSTGVDLDAIPASMIDRIEILRDGATAQYGSGAVAGVVNIVLKSGVHGDAASTLGRSATTYNRTDDSPIYAGGERSASDGRALQASIDKGLVFGERGFLHGAFELRDRGFSNRSLADLRPQYAPGDPRAGSSGLPADRVTHRLGDPQSHDAALFLNGGNLFATGLELYADAGGSRRTMSAAGVYRPAFRGIANATFPDGFLPIIRPTIDDYAGTLGLRGQLDDWAWDLSTTSGRNNVSYDVENTVSGGIVQSQTRFGAGSVRYGQSSTTLELTRALAYFDETRVAAGAEFQAESYRIGAGTAPDVLIEGFPGFGPSQSTDRSRHDVAGYLDIESDVSSTFLVGLAGRVERYSDVGTLGAGKLSARWEPVRRHALRASIERGFRAPSLAQSYFGNAATDIGTGTVGERVIPVDVAGAPALEPERTTSYSVGLAAEPTSALSLSLDVYRVDVKDRVVLLETGGVPASPYYSVNGADTRTHGLDLSANYGLRVDAAGLLRLSAGLDLNSTTITRNLTTGAVALGHIGTTRIERGQPRNTVLASAAFKRDDFGALLRTQRFGQVTVAQSQTLSVPDQTFGARWITDANLSYTLLRKYTFTAGADNLFDVYPDRNNIPGGATTSGNGYFGIFPYNAASPFGFNGRFVYGRLAIYL